MKHILEIRSNLKMFSQINQIITMFKHLLITKILMETKKI
jgi:hypothetical protein